MKRLLLKYREELINLSVANSALMKRNDSSTEAIKELKKVNYQIRSATNIEDHLAISQSLESELERERKVRNEIEAELKSSKLQYKVSKEKHQSIVDSLRKRNEQNDCDIEKLKTENLELTNQIQITKRDMKMNLSVQEDLVKLNQSLQVRKRI
jgi:hypothetical protein